MKAIVFDLDNTLMDWKKEYIRGLEHVVKELGYTFSSAFLEKIDYYINEYEKHFPKLKKDDFLKFINENCGTDFNLDFVNKLIEEQKQFFEINNKVIDTLKYLNKKYDLYIITNWFTETQKGRLKNAQILDLFKEVYGADINYNKPYYKSFDVILEKYNLDEIISIGDSLENDVKFPMSLGISSIWKTDKESDSFKTIKEISDLKKIL